MAYILPLPVIASAIPESVTTLSYYDKYKAKRFHWQETFASSKYRSSFSFAECERTNSSHLAWLMALARYGWGEDFYSNNHQQPNGGIAHRSIT
jgi:hypothetical protein